MSGFDLEGRYVARSPRCQWAGCDSNAKNGTLCKKHANRSAGWTNGTGHSAKRLTDEQKAEIKTRMSRFESPKVIAKSMGITTQTVYYTMDPTAARARKRESRSAS